MFKKIYIITIGILSFLCAGTAIYAMPCYAQSQQHQQLAESNADEQGKPQATQPMAVNAGNKICPVSGEEVGQGGMESAAYEYKGKIYNFCCPSCIDEFKKDPEKYIKKVNEELQATAKKETPQQQLPPASETSESIHTGHQH